MTMMKKKSEEALNTLKSIANSPICEKLGIVSLIFKYQGYGYFKLSQYRESIQCYSQLSHSEKDESSMYNQLLA